MTNVFSRLNSKNLDLTKQSAIFRYTLTYVIMFFVWIIATDKILLAAHLDADLEALISTLKGWFAIAFSAVFIQAAMVRNARALKEREEHFQTVIENSSIGVCVVGLDLKFRTVNDAMCEITGYTKEELYTKTVNDITNKEDIPIGSSLYEQLIQGDVTKASIEKRYIHKNGHTVWVSISASVLRDQALYALFFISHVEDITERKKYFDEIRESEKRLKFALRIAHLGQWTWDMNTNRVTWSDEMFRIFGQDPDTFDGDLEKIIAQAIHPDDREKVHASQNSVVSESKPVTLEYRVVWPDNSIRTVWAEPGEIVLDSTGRVEKLSGIVQDITERKRAEENLQQVEGRLRQYEKMNAIGQLAGGIAHDFNNVLGGIIGYTDMSLGLVEKNSLLENNLRKVMQASDRAKNLVEQILAFSRQSNPQKKVTSIHPIIVEVLGLLRPSIPSSVNIESDLHKDTKPVLADPTQIHQILMNLATNAVHAMNRQGTLTVKLSMACIDAVQYGRSGEIPPGDYSVIEIGDTGCGMDATTLSKAFDPFFTTKAVGEGTGMGLSVVLGLVQSHGGDIQVESVVGRGTTIRMYLPVTDERNSVIENIVTRVNLLGNERIVFVDDEQMLVEMAARMLTPLGYTVTGLYNGIDALNYIKEHRNDIDLLITDQTMLGMTGIELAKEVLKLRKDFPIILSTGFSNEINAERTAAIGIRKFLMKPYGVREISRVIREALDDTQKSICNKRVLVIDDDEIINTMIVQLLNKEGYEAEGAKNGKLGLMLFDKKPFDLIVTDIIMPEKEGLEAIVSIRKKK